MVTSVLHVCTRYRRGGSEQRLRDFVGAVEAEHTLVIGADSDLEQVRADLPGVAVEQWPDLVRSPHPGRDIRALRALVRLLRRDAPDLVFTHQSKGGLLGRLAARATSTPVIHSVSMANTGPGYGRATSAVFALLERSVARTAVGYAVVGEDLRRRVVANGVPAAKCSVIRSGARLPQPGIDRVERRRRLLGQVDLGDLVERPWLVSVGSLEPRKNASLLPDLLERVQVAMPGSGPVLLIAGDGPDRALVEAEVARRGLGLDVVLLGHTDAAPELIAAADAIVMMSRAEGLPQVLVQAAAANTPFACFEVDGAQEVLAMGARGRIVAPGRLEHLAAAAAALLADPVESTEPLIDLSSWDPDVIAGAYREIAARALTTGRATAPRRVSLVAGRGRAPERVRR